MDFPTAVDILLNPLHEGQYSNNRYDPGGETMWGITIRVARRNGYTGDMRYLPRETAVAIYKVEYWDKLQLDKFPDQLKYVVFDAAVNMGVSEAIEVLQTTLGVEADGDFGPLTWDALNKCQGPFKAAVRYEANALDFRTTLPTWGMFGRGWAHRHIANLLLITQP